MPPPSSRSWVWPSIALPLLVVSILGASALWMHMNGFFVRPPTTEAAAFRTWALMLSQKIEAEGLPKALWEHRATHPPLISLVAAGVSTWHGGRLPPVALWEVNAAFGALLAVGLYRLARNFVERPVAWASVAICLSSPIVLVTLRPFRPHLPLAAVVVWALDALVRSGAFRNRGWTLGFSFWAALASLTHVLAPVYLVGGGMAAFLFGACGAARRRVFANVALGACFCGLLLAWWYLPNWDAVTGYAERGSLHSGRGDWSYYPRSLINQGLGFPLACLAAAALAATLVVAPLRARRWPLGALILGASGVVAYAILTLGHTTGESKFVIVLAVLLGVLLIAWVRRLPLGWPRRSGFFLLAMVAMWNHFLCSRPLYEDTTWAESGGVRFVGLMDPYIGGLSRNMKVLATPEGELWPVASFAETILKRAPTKPPRVVDMHPYLCTANLSYELALRGGTLTSLHGLLENSGSKRWLADVDFAVGDTALLSGEIVCNYLRDLGLEAEIVATDRVTEASRVDLIQVTAPWRRRERTEREDLDPACVSVSAEFQGGIALRAYSIARPQVLEGDAVVELLFAMPEGFMGARVRLEGAKSFWETVLAPGREHSVAVLEGVRGPAWKLMLLPPAAQGSNPLAVISSSLPRVEGGVVLAP